MNLVRRIELLTRLGEYMISDDPDWVQAKQEASVKNGWFIPQFIDLAVQNIAQEFLQPPALEKWAKSYKIKEENKQPKTVGLVMAGNIPLVGFHDMISIFLAGHKARIKPSSKDEVLITHLIRKLAEWDSETADLIQIAERLNNSDAYIATGSNNSSRYFEYYFAKYPHIIRRNRTSVAILDGSETDQELEKLAEDVHLYFGLGCRNVTKLYVPEGYDFVRLLNAFKKFTFLSDLNKYKNNYDYNLALLMLNKRYYMTNATTLFVEEKSLFSPISQLNFEYYNDKKNVISSLQKNENVQCVVSKEHVPFGNAQFPTLNDYADGVDTMKFLIELN